MRHSSKSLSFFSLHVPLPFFWKGIFRTYLIFRTLLEWFGVSSLCLVEPCFSPTPADSVLCADYTAFPLDSLIHMLSCFCLKNKNKKNLLIFFYLNSDFFSSWKCLVFALFQSVPMITSVSAIYFLLPSLILILPPNELRFCAHETDLRPYLWLPSSLSPECLRVKNGLCIYLQGWERHSTESAGKDLG